MSVDFNEFARKMDKTLEHLDEEFAAVRAGRANPKVLDRITVEYYGQDTALNGVANISSPDARTLMIQPWDGSLLKAIEKTLDQGRHHIIVTLPYSMGGMVDTLHSGAQVLNVDYTGEGIVVETIVDPILYGKLSQYITKEC